MTAQLLRGEDGYHVWSETWDRTLDDIFAIQDEIAADVVDQLRVTLLGETPTVEETDPEAYALFLRALPGPADHGRGPRLRHLGGAKGRATRPRVRPPPRLCPRGAR